MDKNKTNPHLQEYRRVIIKKRLALALTLILTLIAALISLSLGSVQLPLGEVIQSLAGAGDELSSTVLFDIRMPRILAAIIVGAILATAGAVMQCVLHNPLASASTLGVAQGAAFGAALGIIVFGGGVINGASTGAAIEIDNPYIVTLCAFIFGSLSTVIILALSRLKKSLGPSGLILAGVALGSLFTGGSTLLQYFADETKISAVVFWTFGNLGSANWRQIIILVIVLLAALLYFMFNRWNYNAMISGQETAQTIGVNSRALLLISMAVCSLISAVAVSFVGIISFVGLVAPHMMRRFVGDDYRFLIPCSAAGGALLLVIADTLARLIISPIVLPVGAVTAFLGAPVFLCLLLKGAARE